MNKKKLEDIGKPKNKNKKMKAKLKGKIWKHTGYHPLENQTYGMAHMPLHRAIAPLFDACIEFAFGQGRVRFKYYTSESRDNPTLLATCEQKSRSSVGLTISRLIGSFYLALIWYNEPSQYLFLAC